MILCFRFICFLCMLFGGRVLAADLSDQTIEYQVSGEQYAVVIVMDGLSSTEARKAARVRAAEMAVQQGGRYFTIDKEERTEVIRSEDVPESQRFYGNMYHELIIERDFSRDRLRYESLPNAQTYSAIRLVFTIYKEKPGRKAIDACTLTHCE